MEITCNMQRLAYALAITGSVIALMLSGAIVWLAVTTTPSPGKTFADENFGFFMALATVLGGSYGGAAAILTHTVSSNGKT